MDYNNDFIEMHKERFLEELYGLIRIPSISSTQDNKQDIYKAATYWKELLINSGVDYANIFETEGNPVVYAEKIQDAALPTVLVYSYLDVAFQYPLEQYNSLPFEPGISSGNIVGHGVIGKAQGIIHAKAFEFMHKTEKLSCNVKFMIESEYEIGSPNLCKWCKDNMEMLKADIILTSEASRIDSDVPLITIGFRGLVSWQIEVTRPNRNLHADFHQAVGPNPINVLCSLIDKMVNKNGKITIPGFYDDIMEVSEEERELLGRITFDKIRDINSFILQEVPGENNYTPIERVGIRPDFNVNGIWGGYMGEGAKSGVPLKAHAKISCRLVPDQDYQRITNIFEEYLKEIAPKTFNVKVKFLQGGQGYYCPIDNPAYKAAEKALSDVYRKRPIPFRSGISNPLITMFEEVFGIKSILIGFDMQNYSIHSPVKPFPQDQLLKGIKTISLFYEYFAKMNKMRN